MSKRIDPTPPAGVAPDPAERIDPTQPAGVASDPAHIVLGGRFGEEDTELSFDRLERFVAAGGRWVDTAHSYAGGRAEAVIGAWLREHPGTVQVIDKIGHPDDGKLDLSPAALHREAAESRDRLGVDAIQLLMLHRDDPALPVEALADTLLELVAAGYARQVGVSNWPAGRLDRLARRLAGAGHHPSVSYQFSLVTPQRPIWPGTRHADGRLWRVIRRHGLTLYAWAAHARGFLAGAPEPAEPGQPDPFDTPANRERRDRCFAYARSVSHPPAAVALAWTLHVPGVRPIVGARSVREVEVSMAAARITLDGRTHRWLCGGDVDEEKESCL